MAKLAYLHDEQAAKRSRDAQDARNRTKRERRAKIHAAQLKQAESQGVKIKVIPEGKSGIKPKPKHSQKTRKVLMWEIEHLKAENARLRGERPLSFYDTREWRDLRWEVLRKSNMHCSMCGAGREDGIKLHVDHIKPRSKYPELELVEANLQVLCEPCNMGKSNK